MKSIATSLFLKSTWIQSRFAYLLFYWLNLCILILYLCNWVIEPSVQSVFGGIKNWWGQKSKDNTTKLNEREVTPSSSLAVAMERSELESSVTRNQDNHPAFRVRGLSDENDDDRSFQSAPTSQQIDTQIDTNLGEYYFFMFTSFIRNNVWWCIMTFKLLYKILKWSLHWNEGREEEAGWCNTKCKTASTSSYCSWLAR